MGNKTHESVLLWESALRHIVLVLLFCDVCLGACPREEGNKRKSIEERVHVLAGNGGKWSWRAEGSVLIKRSKQWRWMMHKYMQVQSYLCQLGVEDLKVIAKDLGCSQNEVEGKKIGKRKGNINRTATERSVEITRYYLGQNRALEGV